jgi:hypothetical protein
MSGYITGTGSEDFNSAYEWGAKDRKVRQAVAVDAAVREGVGEMMQRGGAGGYQPPMAQPWGGSGYTPPGAPQAAATAPQSPAQPADAPAAAMTPAPAAVAPEGPGARLRMGTIRVEDPTGRAVNPWGFTGFYQFGTGALKDAGVYEPSAGEDLKRNAWTGTIALPSGKRLSHAEFAADPDAQKEAWDAHQARLGTEIDRRGLNRFIGQTVGGVPITEDSIRAIMHFGGANGAQLFLTTGGSYNPTDANGVSLSAYAQRVLGGQDGYRGPSGGAAPSVAGMGLFGPQSGASADPAGASQGGFNSRMDPLLSRLAQTPGGGSTALSILGSQSRYDMQMLKRQDQMQKNAMVALAKGDMGVFEYYANATGMKIPPHILQNAAVRSRLAVGSLAAYRVYKNDPEQAAIFTNTFVQSGDVGMAARAAGPPRSNPRISIQQVYNEATNEIEYVGVVVQGPNAGQVKPLANPDGTPVTAPPRPQQRLQIVKGAGGYMVIGSDGVARQLSDERGQPGATSGAPSAATLAAHERAMRTVVNADINFMGAKPGVKDAEVNRLMHEAFGPDWRNQMRGAPAAAPSGSLPQAQTGAAPSAPGAAAPAAAQQFHPVTPEAIEFLKQNPGTAAQFDEAFGPGSAMRVLGQ